MSTSATIIIKDETGKKFYINRGHDGHPEIVLPHLISAVNAIQGKWEQPPLGEMTTRLLLSLNAEGTDYLLAQKTRGDDFFQYYVFFDKDRGRWEVTHSFSPDFEEIKQRIGNFHSEHIVCPKCYSMIINIGDRKDGGVFWCDNCDDTYEIVPHAVRDRYTINGKLGSVFFFQPNIQAKGVSQ